MKRLIAALTVLCFTILVPALSEAQSLPFTVCKESRTWTRPAPSVQAKIWNDARYSGLKPENLREWTHDFIAVPADSASIQYHTENTSGLWTEGVFDPKCDHRSDNEWIAIWVLLHRVRSVELTGNTYTIRVDPSDKGFQSILIRRVNPVDTLRFVDSSGRVIDTIGNERLCTKTGDGIPNSPPESGGAAEPEGRAGVVPANESQRLAKEPPQLT